MSLRSRIRRGLAALAFLALLGGPTAAVETLALPHAYAMSPSSAACGPDGIYCAGQTSGSSGGLSNGNPGTTTSGTSTSGGGGGPSATITCPWGETVDPSSTNGCIVDTNLPSNGYTNTQNGAPVVIVSFNPAAQQQDCSQQTGIDPNATCIVVPPSMQGDTPQQIAQWVQQQIVQAGVAGETIVGVGGTGTMPASVNQALASTANAPVIQLAGADMLLGAWDLYQLTQNGATEAALAAMYGPSDGTTSCQWAATSYCVSNPYTINVTESGQPVAGGYDFFMGTYYGGAYYAPTSTTATTGGGGGGGGGYCPPGGYSFVPTGYLQWAEIHTADCQSQLVQTISAVSVLVPSGWVSPGAGPDPIDALGTNPALPTESGGQTVTNPCQALLDAQSYMASLLGSTQASAWGESSQAPSENTGGETGAKVGFQDTSGKTAGAQIPPVHLAPADPVQFGSGSGAASMPVDPVVTSSGNPWVGMPQDPNPSIGSGGPVVQTILSVSTGSGTSYVGMPQDPAPIIGGDKNGGTSDSTGGIAGSGCSSSGGGTLPVGPSGGATPHSNSAAHSGVSTGISTGSGYVPVFPSGGGTMYVGQGSQSGSSSTNTVSGSGGTPSLGYPSGGGTLYVGGNSGAASGGHAPIVEGGTPGSGLHPGGGTVYVGPGSGHNSTITAEVATVNVAKDPWIAK